MRNRNRGSFGQFAGAVAGASIVLGTGLLLAGLSGLRVNTTKSIPVGFYRASAGGSVLPFTQQETAGRAAENAKKGDYVIVCPPSSKVFDEALERNYISAGLCPGGYGYMMKKILAAKNDLVEVTEKGVAVNGELLPLSVPLSEDLAGRKMPVFKVDKYKLKHNEVLLMSDVSSTSFDGRYYGLVDRAQIRNVIIPFYTW